VADRKAAFVDYQQRAAEFAVGDPVSLVDTEGLIGRVMAVFPGIGMVDVEWPHGSQRLPVEELQRLREQEDKSPPHVDNVPGGSRPVVLVAADSHRVAVAYAKKAMYWAAPDRKYRASQGEVDSGQYQCPKCKNSILKPASYKRESGASIRLLGCGNCLFLIKPCDIIGHPEYEEVLTASVQGGTE